MTHVSSSIRRLLVPGALGLAMLGGACSSPTERTAGVPAVSIQHASYSLPVNQGAEVHFSFHNGGAQAATVPSCGMEVSPVVERHEGGEWRRHSSGICLSSFTAGPIRLEPGAVREGRAWVDEPGRYRVRVEYDADGRYMRSSVASPAFVVAR